MKNNLESLSAILPKLRIILILNTEAQRYYKRTMPKGEGHRG